MRQPPVSKSPGSGTTATDTRTGPQWPTSSPAHQGTRVVPGAEPVVNLRLRVTAPARQKMELDALQAFNESHQSTRQDDPYLATRIKSFETAFGMQSEMPEALDLSKETDETLAMYGLKRGQTDGFGWQCLVARRLVERGVRFVELIHTGSSNNWDSHGNMADHGRLAQQVDQPMAGLIRLLGFEPVSHHLPFDSAGSGGHHFPISGEQNPVHPAVAPLVHAAPLLARGDIPQDHIGRRWRDCQRV